MNPWEVLCIPQTSDETAVRQAYAKLVKTRRPEGDMQAFQDLRNAYEQALTVCRISRIIVDTHDFQAECDAEQEETRPLPDLPLPFQEEMKPLPDLQHPFSTNDFIDQFKALAKDYATYSDQALWLTLLNKAYDLNYWEREVLGHKLALILTDFQFLPSFVWIKLEKSFNWEQNRGHLNSQYHNADLNWLKHMGEVARLLCTEEILPCQGGSEFIVALIDFYAHRDAIKKADTKKRLNGLYIERDELPAALRLYFSLLKSIGDWETLSTPEKFFKGNDNDHFISLLRGEALRHLGDYAGARNVYEDIFRRHPNHIDALRWSALCMERLGDASLAVERYRLVLDILSEDVYSKCAIQRLTTTHAVKRHSWRNWFFRIGDAFRKFMFFVVIALVLLGAILHLFSLVLPFL